MSKKENVSMEKCYGDMGVLWVLKYEIMGKSVRKDEYELTV